MLTISNDRFEKITGEIDILPDMLKNLQMDFKLTMG
jgi:hypothetical protein